MIWGIKLLTPSTTLILANFEVLVSMLYYQKRIALIIHLDIGEMFQIQQNDKLLSLSINFLIAEAHIAKTNFKVSPEMLSGH